MTAAASSGRTDDPGTGQALLASQIRTVEDLLLVRNEALAIRLALQQRRGPAAERAAILAGKFADVLGSAFSSAATLQRNSSSETFSRLATMFEIGAFSILVSQNLGKRPWSLRQLLPSLLAEGLVLSGSSQYIFSSQEDTEATLADARLTLQTHLWDLAGDLREDVDAVSLEQLRTSIGTTVQTLADPANPSGERAALLLQLYALAIRLRALLIFDALAPLRETSAAQSPTPSGPGTRRRS